MPDTKPADASVAVTPPGGVPDISLLEYLWREYEYRHDLCWRAVYKVTFAVVALAIVPYLREDLTIVLARGALLPPLIGTLLAGFGVLLVRNELARFAATKLAYNHLQDRLWDRVISDSAVRCGAKRGFAPERATRTPFDVLVTFYVVVLFLLSLANAWFVARRWLPSLLGS